LGYKFKDLAMNESQDDCRETGKDILEYLSSLRLLASDLDVEVNTARYAGLLQVRGGTVRTASQGSLSGNGALFTLVTQGVADIQAVKSVESVVANVTVSHDQMIHICSKIPAAAGDKATCNEAALLDAAVHLFLQFRKKEAGAKLVEILRCNRFYYPAWLWHSRLMSRVDYLGKALNEMKKWGGHDSLVKRELAKIEPQLSGKQGGVKRCIFCWAIVEAGQEHCSNCNCLLSISAKRDKSPDGHKELEESLARYEQEFVGHSKNSRIAYCLCLGKFSLGKTEQAQDYLNKAIEISPAEQLFLKTSRFLKNLTVAKSVPREEKKPEEVKAAVHTVASPVPVEEKKPEEVKAAVHTVASPVPVEEKKPEAVKAAVHTVASPVPVEEKKPEAVKAAVHTVASPVPVEEKKPVEVKVVPLISSHPATEVKGKTILVIEDSNTSRKVISLVLNRQGYNIVEATTGGEGLGRLVDVVPDLVLLDVMLPDMDGYQVLAEMRSSTRLKEVPVVMLTGKRSSTDRMKGLASGANEYLTKPFDPAKLLNVLGRFLGPSGKKTVSAPVKKIQGARVSRVAKKPVQASVAMPVKTPTTKRIKTEVPFILIVEDSPTTRKVISLVLTRKGYAFKEATTGKEALQEIESRVPDLILLDAMLPDMTGYDILDQLQKNEMVKKIPVVMLTAKTGATDRHKGMKAGAVAYLTKPFNPDKLLSTVAQHMPAGSSATNLK
jgi:DNA-binding response OmpR family regulator